MLRNHFKPNAQPEYFRQIVLRTEAVMLLTPSDGQNLSGGTSVFVFVVLIFLFVTQWSPCFPCAWYGLSVSRCCSVNTGIGPWSGAPHEPSVSHLP